LLTAPNVPVREPRPPRRHHPGHRRIVADLNPEYWACFVGRRGHGIWRSAHKF
jgi:hypothetical protein